MSHHARFMIKQSLETKGYRVVEAANGWDAVGLAHQARPDLILMDLHLPVFDGIDATCLLRELDEFRDVPIIAMTTHDSADSRADALEVRERRRYEWLAVVRIDKESGRLEC